MALDKFVEKWESFEEVTGLVKSLSDNRGDEDAFNQYWRDLAKHAREVYGELVPSDEQGIEEKSAFASLYHRAARDDAYAYSDANIHAILNQAKKKAKDRLFGLVATMEPTGKDKKYHNLRDAVKKYQEITKPFRTETGEPDMPAIRSRILKLIDDKLGSKPDIKVYVDALKAFYSNVDAASYREFKGRFIEPAEKKLKEAYEKADVVGYVRDNLSEQKKPDKIGFYHALFKACK